MCCAFVRGLRKRTESEIKRLFIDCRQVSDSVRIVTELSVATKEAWAIKMCLNEKYLNIPSDKYFYFIFLIRNDLKQGDVCYEGKYRKVFRH